MNEPTPTTNLPKAEAHRSRWSVLLLAIPLAALFIVGYLGIQALAHRGTLITVTFDRVSDVRAGDTKVQYEGAQAGELVKLTPNKDGKHFDYRLRMMSGVPESWLTANAQFWLIGVSPSLSDLSSLKATVSGVTIGFRPGSGGAHQTHFVGLSKEPVVSPQDHGKYIVLNTRSLGPIAERSEILYRGQSVGKVADIQMTNEHHFRLKVFVFSQFESLVKSSSLFWLQSPLSISLTGGELRTDLAPSSTILAGGIAMDTEDNPGEAGDGAATEFTLYPTEAAARQRLMGPAVRYRFVFTGDTGGFAREAPINLMSFQIGEVESSHLSYDSRSGAPQTIVTGLIYPLNLALPDFAPGSGGDLRIKTDEAINRLLARGFRAKLIQTPAFVGSPAIALAPVPRARAAALEYDGDVARVPTTGHGSEFDAILAQVEQILAKVNQVPIPSIGRDVKQLTGKLAQLANAPETADALAHLKDASAKIDQILATAQPQIGPLMNSLNRASGQLAGDEGGAGLRDMLLELTEAARALRSLSDYLERHPEALIRGNPPEK